MRITIDEEFKTLIPPLAKEEYEQLEENCKQDGILDSLKVWNGILIDGHNRYRIAQENGLDYEVEEMDFPDRTSAEAWIIRHQLGRRNLSAYDRSVLALRLKPLIAEKAKEHQGERTDICQKSDRSSIDTKKELAAIAGVSHDTIHKVEVIESKAPEVLKRQIRNGDKSINAAYGEVTNRETKRLPTAKEYREQAQERHDAFKEQKSVSFDEVRQDKQDKEIISAGVQKDILKAVRPISELYVLISAKELDVSLLSEKSKSKLVTELEYAKGQLTTIQKILTESR